MSDAFSSSSEAVLQRTVNVSTVTSSHAGHLMELYQIAETCQFVTSNQFKKVALQFPDELLPDAVRVSAEIESKTKAKTFILGDTSYGSCCVDEVAAEHVKADCIVHYGPSCLSPCRRLPLLHVFGKRPIDVQQCFAAFKELHPDRQSHVVILYDVTYSHAIGGSSHVDFPEPNLSAMEDETTDVSLITGALRACSTPSSETINGTSVVPRNQTLTVANTNTAASFLAGRSWQGLESKLGQTPVVKAVEGRRGIAIAYEEEGVDHKDTLTSPQKS